MALQTMALHDHIEAAGFETLLVHTGMHQLEMIQHIAATACCVTKSLC